MSVIGVLSTLISLFSVLCLAAALCSPGWVIIGNISDGIHSGLFYVCSFLGNSRRCELYSGDLISTEIIIVLGLSSASVLLGLPGSLTVLSGAFSRFGKNGFLIGGIFCIISGILSISSAGYFTSLQQSNFGYSFYLAWIGGGLALLGGLMSIGAYNQDR